jgi:hypothetical protein
LRERGKWRMENGEWKRRMEKENGKWRMENRNWRMQNGE